ncbi:MAG: CHAT domain-containing protein [Bacteroidales bacterium]|nr:CHAT domain-containing protein [Bacteroidales bacterium]MCF8334036.1 CHAT domain-containing protein [Bacteroidales bacterium]
MGQYTSLVAKAIIVVILLSLSGLSAFAQQEDIDSKEKSNKELAQNNITEIKKKVKSQPAAALQLFHKTLTKYNEVLSKKDIASLLATMAQSTVFTHTFFARQMANKALGIIEEASIHDPLIYANVYHALGYSYLAQGVFEKSIKPFQKNLHYTLQHDSINNNRLQKSYSNLATAYNYTRQADSALKYSAKALEITRKHVPDNPMALASNYGNLSRAVTLTGDIDSAINLRKKALQIQEKIFGPKGHKTATSYYYLGNLYMSKGNFQNALDYAQQTMLSNFPDEKQEHSYDYLPPKIGKHTNTNGVLQALMLKINLFETLYAQQQDQKWLKKALTHYQTVDTLVNILQQSQSEESLKRLIGINIAGYNKAVSTTYQLAKVDSTSNYDEKLYSFASATKGKLLSYQMYKMKSGESQIKNTSQEIPRLETDLRELKNHMQIAGKREKDSLQMITLVKKARLLALKISEKKSSESGAGIDLDRFKITLKEIRDNLQEDEALIEYSETGKYLNIFCSTSENSVIKRIKKDSQYEHAYQDFLRSVKTGALRADAKLSNYLLKPVYKHIADKKHLVVIPEDKLYSIPFEALNVPGKSHAMIRDHSMSYHYSAKLWAENHLEKTSEKRSITLFAPGFVDESVAELTERNAYRGENLFSLEEIINWENRQLVSLPHSLEEVSQISTMFETNDLKTSLMTRKQATEENFRTTTKSEIIHVATHGVSSKDQPGQSGLFFSQPEIPEKGQHEKDGFLFVNELFSMELDADLIVLSACKSGAGQILKGEGVFGLPRGFIFAGAPNLIASLWKIHDEKTKTIINSFYRHLLEGKDYATALQQAKIEMIERGELPLDWSGIVLIGR